MHSFLLQQSLTAALIKAPRRTAPQLELLFEQLPGQGTGGQHDQIIDAQTIRWEWITGAGGEDQIGAGITVRPPELPPKAPLGAPVALRQLRAESLLPKGWSGLRRPRRKALQQCSVGHEPVEAAGQTPGHQQHQRSRNQQQGCTGEGGDPQGQMPQRQALERERLQTHAGTAP